MSHLFMLEYYFSLEDFSVPHYFSEVHCVEFSGIYQ